MSILEQDFHNAMLNIYNRANQECNYRPTIFLSMIHDKGAINAAKSLINSPKVSWGFTKLYELGRLDLSVEALIMQTPFTQLFTVGDLDIAKKRLKEYRYIM